MTEAWAEGRESRGRLQALESDDATDGTPGGPPPMVGRTASGGSYPSAPKSFFLMHEMILTGREVEGEPADLADSGRTFFAANVGGVVPTEGTDHLCEFVAYRWVFEHG